MGKWVEPFPRRRMVRDRDEEEDQEVSGGSMMMIRRNVVEDDEDGPRMRRAGPKVEFGTTNSRAQRTGPCLARKTRPSDRDHVSGQSLAHRGDECIGRRSNASLRVCGGDDDAVPGEQTRVGPSLSPQAESGTKRRPACTSPSRHGWQRPFPTSNNPHKHKRPSYGASPTRKTSCSGMRRGAESASDRTL